MTTATIDRPRALSHLIAGNAQALARATKIAWIVSIQTARPRNDGARDLCSAIHVAHQGLMDPPDAAFYVPVGHCLLRADVFPATRFDDMHGPAHRRLYEQHYRAYLAWRSSHAGIEPNGVNVAYRADQWCKDGRP